MLKKISEQAFSLIELMVVISIIAIVAAVSLGTVGSIQKNSRDVQRKADLQLIQGAIQQYYADKNRYPNDLPSLSAGGPITNCSGTATPCTVSRTYLSETPKDPNNSSYFYRANNSDGNSCGLVGGVEIGICHKYVLCTTLETSPAYTGSTPLCSTGSYNYRLDQP